MYMDEPIENGPSNWFDGYYGNISLRYAIETSVNTIPYRLMESLGVDKCKKYLTNMEFKYLTQRIIHQYLQLEDGQKVQLQ